MAQTITIDSPVGRLAITASLRGIQQISRSDAAVSETVPVHMQPWLRALSNYFAGRGDLRAIPVDPRGGTELQRKVWQALQDIEHGETVTYSQLAERVGEVAAVRAVASACGKNPVAIIIPCHRVLAKDGTLGGYAWGLPMKEQLLALERAPVFQKAA
tara:strand:- start:280 stop:753 length:474 start_codon:yes stop_codon:yes gene_type:complete